MFLAHHYIDKIYIDDTLKLDASGSGIFIGDTLLRQGLYKIYLDENGDTQEYLTKGFKDLVVK